MQRLATTTTSACTGALAAARATESRQPGRRADSLWAGTTTVRWGGGATRQGPTDPRGRSTASGVMGPPPLVTRNLAPS